MRLRDGVVRERDHASEEHHGEDEAAERRDGTLDDTAEIVHVR
jgi:hypothetical protein